MRTVPVNLHTAAVELAVWFWEERRRRENGVLAQPEIMVRLLPLLLSVLHLAVVQSADPPTGTTAITDNVSSEMPSGSGARVEEIDTNRNHQTAEVAIL